MIYAYADETEFSLTKNDNNMVLGTGIFISQHEISQELIDEALKRLELDPDQNDFDKKNTF